MKKEEVKARLKSEGYVDDSGIFGYAMPESARGGDLSAEFTIPLTMPF